MKNKKIEELINLYKSGKLNVAEKEAAEQIKNDSNNYILFNILGAILTDQKKLNEAIIKYKKSIEINPDYAEGYNNLGSVLYKLKKFDESIEAYKKAIKIKPNFAEGYNNLGITFKEIGKYDESIEAYKKAIKIKPNFAEAYNNIGIVYKELKKFEKSVNNYLKAIQIKSDYAEAYYNYANLLAEMQKINDAILNYKKAIELNDHYYEAYNNLGNLLKDIIKINDAQKYLDKLITLRPDHIGYKINRNLLIPPICETSKEISYFRNEYEKGIELLKKYKYFNKNPAQSIGTHFFYLAYHNEDNLKIMKNTSSLFRKILPNINYTSKNIEIDKNKDKIKIGFISEFLTNHTVGRIFNGFIKNLNKKKFEIVVFHTSQTKEGLLKNEIDNAADKVNTLSNEITSQHKEIENEKLDILFYTDIGMSPTTYFLAFSRLAPIQIVSWGHTETTGIDTIDYFLSSRFFESNIKYNKYSERLICLNQIPAFYEPIKNIKLNKTRSELGLPENVNLYGCPQSLFKLHPDFDMVMSSILKKDNKGYIILVEGKENESKEKYWSEALQKRWSKSFPILNKKVIFLKRLSQSDYLSLCKCVDVLLDPMHFGAGYTFLLTTLVGTPTITLPGKYLRKNMTFAAYMQMQLSSPPIAKNYEEYVNLAVELAENKKKNASLREEIKIAANKYLYNNSIVLKDFEKFLEEAYKARKKGEKLKDGYIINEN